MLAAAAVTAAPVWRNLRRSVRFVSSWPIAIDSSSQGNWYGSLPKLFIPPACKKSASARLSRWHGRNLPKPHFNRFAGRWAMDWPVPEPVSASQLQPNLSVRGRDSRPHRFDVPLTLTPAAGNTRS